MGLDLSEHYVHACHIVQCNHIYEQLWSSAPTLVIVTVETGVYELTASGYVNQKIVLTALR